MLDGEQHGSQQTKYIVVSSACPRHSNFGIYTYRRYLGNIYTAGNYDSLSLMLHEDMVLAFELVLSGLTPAREGRVRTGCSGVGEQPQRHLGQAQVDLERGDLGRET